MICLLYWLCIYQELLIGSTMRLTYVCTKAKLSELSGLAYRIYLLHLFIFVVVHVYRTNFGIRDWAQRNLLEALFFIKMWAYYLRFLGFKVIIEGYSKNAVRWFKRKASHPWRLAFIFREIEVLVSSVTITFAHVHKEADVLAKDGVDLDSTF